MSNCYNCKKKFVLFNVDRRRCKECEQYFCYNCTPNLLSNFCRICKILNTRPAVHSMIIKLRSRELKLYLARRRIQTDSCLEKDDLVRCFFRYVSLEPQLKNKHDYARLNASWSSSVPNLHTNQNRFRGDTSQSQTPPARTPHTSTSTFSGGMGTSTSDQTASSESFTENGDAFAENTTTRQPSNEDVTETNSPERDVKRIKLTEITVIQDIHTLSIKQLKDVLSVNRVDYKGCVEKEELIGKVEQLWKALKDRPDVSTLPHGDLCKICMDAPLNSVLLECGHIVSCINCGKQLSECPVCRQYVVRVVHTFKA